MAGGKGRAFQLDPVALASISEGPKREYVFPEPGAPTAMIAHERPSSMACGNDQK